ncbi:MAG: class II fructose-bisphosphate aldolase [Candidatus Paceibacterota bacterium]|jgi:fructose-bisphosphate aldolase class II
MKTLREVINEAATKRVAIGHFNISNLETLWAIFNSAKSLDVPVIIGVSEGERGFIGTKQAAALVKSVRDEYNYPIFINADHCFSFEKVKEAIDAGYDSAIFDGAQKTLDENILITKKCVEYARASGRDVLVEGELGYIGTSSKLLDKIPDDVLKAQQSLTSPEDAARFVKETGVDLFAPSVGNIHGMLANAPEPRLNIELVAKIKEATGVPLVLHGGSGNSDEDFSAAIKAGISVVHINTELRVAWRRSIDETLSKNPTETTPYKIAGATVSAISEVVSKRLKLFSA